MRTFSVAISVSGLLSTGSLAVLVVADRQLGVPVPYAIALVVAILNIAAALAIVLPKRTPVPARIADGLSRPMRVARTPRTAAAQIDEAVVWFEPAPAQSNKEAA